MNILAIDTASEYLSLAISKDSQIKSSLDLVNNQQSNYIINKINDLLKEQNLTIKDINLIAYNQGPGSFTGLRIGLSVAIGIAIGLNIDLIPIPAFAILAKASNLDGKLLIGVDARLDQLYIAGFDSNSSNYTIEPCIENIQDIKYYDNYTFCGYKIDKYWTKLHSQAQEMPFVNLPYPDASNIIQIVNSNIYSKVSAANAKLLYLRNKIALNLEEQQNAAKLKH